MSSLPSTSRATISLAASAMGCEVGGLAGKFDIRSRQRLLAGGVDKKTADAVEEVISGSAGDRPRFTQALAGLQNLFHHDPGLGSGAAEPYANTLRVAQAIDMIDADAVKHALQQPSQHQAMRIGEDLFVLHAQPDQSADIEEAAVAEIASGRAPERQTIILPFQHRVEQVVIGVECGDRSSIAPATSGEDPMRPVDGGLQHSDIALAAVHALAVGRGRKWQRGERIGDERQFVAAASLRRPRQQVVQRARRHRERSDR